MSRTFYILYKQRPSPGSSRGGPRDVFVWGDSGFRLLFPAAGMNQLLPDIVYLVQALEIDLRQPVHRDHFIVQLQADIINRAVYCPAIRETTALGAAYLAGLAVGLWTNRSEIKVPLEVRQYLPAGYVCGAPGPPASGLAQVCGPLQGLGRSKP